MGKFWLLTWIITALMLFSASITYAEQASQTVTVTVISGIITINSPIQDNVYQKNNILLDFSVESGSNEVKTIWLIEGKEKSILCSKCKLYSKEGYFGEGKHQITIKVEFENKETIEKTINFEVDSKSDIYIITSSGLKKANAKDIVNYLFNYNFSMSHKNEMAPDDSCSVRARNGNAVYNGNDFGTNNNINFYSVTSIEQGQVGLKMQNKRKSLSMKFKVSQTLENSDNLLKLELTGKENAILEYDKTNNVVKITGDDFEINNMQVYFSNGCSAKKENFWLIEKIGRLDRSIDEVREILNNNPVFLERFGSLKVLFREFWWRFSSLIV